MDKKVKFVRLEGFPRHWTTFWMDTELSWNAKAILGLVLQHGSIAGLSYDDIIANSPDDITATNAAIEQLRSLGYLCKQTPDNYHSDGAQVLYASESRVFQSNFEPTVSRGSLKFDNDHFGD